ncbi:MAG TPA: ABC transporter ATP-binding protein [Myxococcales bacterium]
MRELAVSARNVRKRFGPTVSLDGLDLAVPAGAVFGFLGPNGAGKTTTLRTLLGLVRPDSGEISVLGIDPAAQPQEIRRKVGVLLEGDGLYDRLSAWRNLDYHARIHHLSSEERGRRIQDGLERMRLWDRRDEMVVTWSRGMRQRLAIARALLHRPRLLLLDEPFSGLDPEAAVELRGQIASLASEQGITVFLTTHDLAHVERVCTEVAVLIAGRVVAAGSPASLAQRSGNLELEATGVGLTDEILERLRSEQLVLGFDRQKDVVRIRCTQEHRTSIGPELVRRGVLLESLSLREGSLEDAFLSLIRDGGAK